MMENKTCTEIAKTIQPTIGEVLEDKNKRIAQLERELAETRAIIDKEAKDYAQTYLENQALAAKVVQMREGIKTLRFNLANPNLSVIRQTDFLRGVDAILTIDTKTAKQIINGVKAQALRDFADAQDAIRGGVGLLPFELRRMADEMEKK